VAKIGEANMWFGDVTTAKFGEALTRLRAQDKNMKAQA
jgi:hypothetical protein